MWLLSFFPLLHLWHRSYRDGICRRFSYLGFSLLVVFFAFILLLFFYFISCFAFQLFPYKLQFFFFLNFLYESGSLELNEFVSRLIKWGLFFFFFNIRIMSCQWSLRLNLHFLGTKNPKKQRTGSGWGWNPVEAFPGVEIFPISPSRESPRAEQFVLKPL